MQDVLSVWGELILRGPVNVSLRKKCRFNLQLFMETHAADTFSGEWAPYHIEAIKKLEAVVLRGQLYAMAFPRGGGKSSLAKWAMIWALVYGHSPYGVFIACTGKVIKKEVKKFKKILLTNPKLLEQFPEIICPILHLGNEARRASQQHAGGQLTEITWEQDEIVFARLPAESCPWLDELENGFEGKLEFASMEGAIRGGTHQRIDGTIVRPTFSIVDDPQTRKSAKSPKQVDYREEIIMSDVRYLAGDNKANGIAVTCTIIYDDDLADRLTDPKRRPLFRGSRYAMLLEFPTNMELWEQYAEIQEQSYLNDGEGEEATAFYKKNWKKMDAGARVSWKQRFDEGKLSAIQHAMDCYFESESAFQSECQNSPLKRTSGDLLILPKASDLAQRLGILKPKVIPDGVEKLVSFIDVGESILWWAVMAIEPDWSGRVVDFGTWPDQKMSYVTKATVRIQIKRKFPKLKIEDAVEAAVAELLEDITTREYFTQSGDPVAIDRTCVDSGHMATRIYSVVKQFRSRRVWATKGIGITESRRPLIDPEKKPKKNESIEGQLVVNRRKRLITFDTNHWKTFGAKRLIAEADQPSAIGFNKFKARPLQSFCDQLVAEEAYKKFGYGRHVYVFDQKLDDNHYWDCYVGCLVAAFLEGLKISGVSKKKKTKKPAGNAIPAKKPTSKLAARRLKKK